MLEWDGQERTEQPTPARREEARRRGDVPRSADLTLALSLLAGLSALYLLGPWLLEKACQGTGHLLGQVAGGGGPLTTQEVQEVAASGAVWLLLCLVPLAVCACGIAVASGVLQSGAVLRSLEPWPDFGRLSLRRAVRRILSSRSVARGGFAILKLVAVGALVAWTLAGLWGRLAGSTAAGPGAFLSRDSWTSWWSQVGAGALWIALAFVGLGAAEYAFQRWQHERDLRMTRAELEEEMLRLEGNRQYKSHRRREGTRVVETARDSAGTREGP